MPDRLPLPADRAAVIELYFAEHRAKLLDIAAFLDRIDRAAAAGGPDEDFRLVAFRKALAILADGHPQRARRVLELLSDPTSEPIASAGTKGATGAWAGGSSRLLKQARPSDSQEPASSSGGGGRP